MWPPPQLADNIPLQRLVEAQKLLQRKQKAESAQAGMGDVSASSSERQQGSVKKHTASQGSASRPAARVMELVRGLLAARNIEMASMDRDAIEKLRVGSWRSVCL